MGVCPCVGSKINGARIGPHCPSDQSLRTLLKPMLVVVCKRGTRKRGTTGSRLGRHATTPSGITSIILRTTQGCFWARAECPYFILTHAMEFKRLTFVRLRFRVQFLRHRATRYAFFPWSRHTSQSISTTPAAGMLRVSFGVHRPEVTSANDCGHVYAGGCGPRLPVLRIGGSLLQA